MKRQLYMGGGIMNAVPREQYGLGSVFKGAKKAVKKVTGAVKDIAKSDIGKAALLYAGTAGLGALGAKLGSGVATSGFGGIFNPGNVLKNLGASKTFLADKFLGPQMVDTGSEVFRKGTKFSKALGIGGDKGGNLLTKGLALAGLSTFLTQTLGMTPEQAEAELARDPSTYLEQYYRNLNPPTADTNSEQYEAEVRDFVARNISEYAVGGRVGFAEGTYKDFEEFMMRRSEAMSERQKEELRKQFEMYMRSKDPTVEAAEGGRIGFANGPVLPPDTTQPVNPFGPKPGDFGIEEDIPIKMASNMENDKILEALFEKYIDMGLSPKDAAKAAQEEFDRMSKQKMESTRGIAALGGRMGFDEGSPKGIEDLMSLTDETIDIPMEDAQRAPSILDKFDENDIVIIIETGPDGKPKLVPMRKSELMPGMAGSDSLSIVAPRNNKAKGNSASMNAMQAAGIEGLPIRQNQAGVKELDLRNTGGFIQPVGIKEKADDIPAMLSNNEFVFTADAVRGAGGGDVNVGAQRMYDTMKRLEAGGKA